MYIYLFGPNNHLDFMYNGSIVNPKMTFCCMYVTRDKSFSRYTPLGVFGGPEKDLLLYVCNMGQKLFKIYSFGSIWWSWKGPIVVWWHHHHHGQHGLSCFLHSKAMLRCLCYSCLRLSRYACLLLYHITVM